MNLFKTGRHRQVMLIWCFDYFRSIHEIYQVVLPVYHLATITQDQAASRSHSVLKWHSIPQHMLGGTWAFL